MSLHHDKLLKEVQMGDWISIEKQDEIEENERGMREDMLEEEPIQNSIRMNAPPQLKNIDPPPIEDEFEEERERHVGFGEDNLIEAPSNLPILNHIGGDGHYMRQIKNELNENWMLRYEDLHIPLQDIGVEQIKNSGNEGMLEKVIAKMDRIISACRKYRFFHLWPWTRKGKERKADVIRTQREAEEKREAAEKRLRRLRREEASHGNRGITDVASRGANKALAYFRTFAFGMTIRNAINTVGFAATIVPWLISSAVRSIARGKLVGSFGIPRPHMPSAWYAHYLEKNEERVKNNMEKRRDKLQASLVKCKSPVEEMNIQEELDYLNNNLNNYRGVKNEGSKGRSNWHTFFSGAHEYDPLGYSETNFKTDKDGNDMSGNDMYNNMQQI